MKMRLYDMTVGEKAAVTGMHAIGSIRRRLQDMGLTEGAEVECVIKSPLGDPTAYLVKGAIIALRKEQASDIIVTAQG